MRGFVRASVLVLLYIIVNKTKDNESTKVQTLGELRMRGNANGGLGYCRLPAVSC